MIDANGKLSARPELARAAGMSKDTASIALPSRPFPIERHKATT